jgi:adenine-specific DNA methylase
VSNDILDVKKSNDYNSTIAESEFEKSVEEEIEQARNELTTMVLAKQKEVVCRMGEALEKIRKGERRHSICEELKNRLREEVAGRIISERTIENHCKPEWKDPHKSKSGKKGANSKNKSLSPSAERFAAPLENTVEMREHEKPENQREHAILVSTTGTIDSLNDDPINDKAASATTNNNSPEYKEQLDKMSKHTSEQTANSISENQTVSSYHVVFEFWLPFREVEKEMKRRFAEQGSAAKLWFNGIIDATTSKVFTVNVGRINEIPDENEISDTGNQ